MADAREEAVARAIKAHLMAETGFGTKYDDEGSVAAFYGGHWVVLDTGKIARAAIAALEGYR